ncbi:MAG: CBS domain-containing protein [Chloroflexi bacterium]|jgi:CBS domain-containing protein|nr:CBS domain-containing protein [Anaerolineaceae bacterium]NMB90559.1 CBS domain-containing protein [Chloroflexota bacterium]
MNKKLVGQWMTKEVVLGDPHMRLHDALRVMNRTHIRALPVVDNEQLVGIVTKRDLLRADVTPVIRNTWDQYRMVGNLTLEKIMTSGVLTTKPEAHVAKASQMMLENKITALPVLDGEAHLSGILTSSDLFRVVMDEVPGLEEGIQVLDYMTPDVVTVDPFTTLLEAHRLMAVKRIRSLPVVKNELLMGIVTRTDLLTAAPSVVVTQGRFEVTDKVLGTPISFIMTSQPITIAEDAAITEAARLMLENKIHSLPVVNADQDLCGIITETDLFRLLVNRFLA